MQNQTIDLDELKKEMIEEITKNIMEKIREQEKGKKDKEKEIIELLLKAQEYEKQKKRNWILLWT